MGGLYLARMVDAAHATLFILVMLAVRGLGADDNLESGAKCWPSFAEKGVTVNGKLHQIKPIDSGLVQKHSFDLVSWKAKCKPGFKVRKCTLYQVELARNAAMLVSSVGCECKTGCSCRIGDQKHVPYDATFKSVILNRNEGYAVSDAEFGVAEACYNIYFKEKSETAKKVVRRAQCPEKASNNGLRHRATRKLLGATGKRKDKKRWVSPSSHVDFLTKANHKLLEQSLEKELGKVQMRGPYGTSKGKATMACHAKLPLKDFYEMRLLVDRFGTGYWTAGSHKITSHLLDNVPKCNPHKEPQMGTNNCCPESCGPTTRFGGRPLSWDDDATTWAAKQKCAKTGVIVKTPQKKLKKTVTLSHGTMTPNYSYEKDEPLKEDYCKTPIMCPKPPNMAEHEHVIRFAPCSGEAAPLCIRIKITHGTGKKDEPLVLGWVEAVPAQTDAGSKSLDSLKQQYKIEKYIGTVVASDGTKHGGKGDFLTTKKTAPISCAKAEELGADMAGVGARFCLRIKHLIHAHKDAENVIEQADNILRQALVGLRFKAGKVAANLGRGRGN